MPTQQPVDPPWLDTKWTTPMFKDLEKAQNNIKRILALPCSPDYPLYVELAADAALRAFGDVLSPDPKEVYHKVVGRSLVCSVEAAVKDGVSFQPKDAGRFTRFLFNFPKFADLAVWWLFLADVAAEGVYNWSSMALRQGACPNPRDPRYGAGSLYAGGCYNDGVWRECDFSFPLGTNYYPVSPSGVDVRAGGAFTVAASVTFKAGDVKVGTASRLMAYGPNAILDQDNNGNDDGTASRSNHVFYKGKNGTDEIIVVQAEWAYTGPFFQVLADEGGTCNLFSSGV